MMGILRGTYIHGRFEGRHVLGFIEKQVGEEGEGLLISKSLYGRVLAILRLSGLDKDYLGRV